MSKQDIANFWLAMTEQFMPWFGRNYGKKPTQAWIDVLTSMGKQDVRQAYKIALNNFEVFPPTPRQFLDLLLSKKDTKKWDGVNHQSPAPAYLIEQSIKKAEKELGTHGAKGGYAEFRKKMIKMGYLKDANNTTTERSSDIVS